MKVAIDKKSWSFRLSPLGLDHYMKLSEKPCFFYSYNDQTHLFSELKHPLEYYKTKTRDIQAFSIKCVNELNRLLRSDELTLQETLDNRSKYYITRGGMDRDDPNLIKTIEDLGIKAWGHHSKIEIVEIPDDSNYFIATCKSGEKIFPHDMVVFIKRVHALVDENDTYNIGKE